MTYVLDSACYSKNVNGSYGGHSPIQWFHGTEKQPRIESDQAPPSLSGGSDFEDHLLRRTQAAKAFHEAEAKTMLRLATLARSRTLRTPQLGQTVYYYRRGKGSQKPGYRGLARVIAVEPPHGDTQTSSVVWLSHAATLIRAASEHLRTATPLETQIYDIVIQGSPQAPSVVPQEAKRRLGRHYVELGEPPTDQERLDADEEGK